MEEGFFFFVVGMEMVSWVLMVIIYYVLMKLEILRKLIDEVREVVRVNNGEVLDWKMLEGFFYLGVVFYEGLRLLYGFVSCSFCVVFIEDFFY